MHDEVFDKAPETPHTARDNTAGSSPSEAYAHLTLDSDTDHHPRPEHKLKAPPRSSSPAKRLHSEMDQDGQPPKRQTRDTSVDMLDAPPQASSPLSTTETLAEEAAVPALSLQQQAERVTQIHNRPFVDGQDGFVVSNKWLQRVFARIPEYAHRENEFDKEALEGPIGPVDNSDLIDASLAAEGLVDKDGRDFVPLRAGLMINNDFEILPREAWDLIVGWYGIKDGSPEIRRRVHNTAVDGVGENLQYEVYPPIFTIRKVSQNASDSANKASPKLVASRNDRYMDFLRSAKKAAGIELSTKVQVWRVLNTEPVQPTPSLLTPESSQKTSRAASPAAGTTAAVPLNMDLAAFNAMTPATERELVAGKDETANEKYNGRSTLDIMGLAADQVLILEEEDKSGKYLGDTAPKTSKASSVMSKKGAQSTTSSGRNSPAPSTMMTRGRSRNGRTQGTVGLTNLGNTCYMNSALQCIRSVEELSVYFLQGKYKQELNVDNPLGHNGAIAKSYAGLLAQLYTLDGFSSFPPRNFKATLGRAQPLFSGYGQQDSQEFLSFLIDGLHEDLNRIIKKPYTENPESDDNTVHDPEAIKALGEKFREIHRARNDSVAMDLFNGFYKNTMVCPDCDKVSITFDPYSALTLQLPVEQTFQHPIIFVPRKGEPIKIDLDIDKNSTIKDVKLYIARRFEGVKWSRIVITEVYTHKFYKVFADSKCLPELNINQRDLIVAYELETTPTNWPPRKKKGGYKSMFNNSSEEENMTPMEELAKKMLVPIFHRAPTSTYRANTLALQLWPSYIVLTREEAKDIDAIKNKILNKVAQMTTKPFLNETSGNRSPGDSDIVLTTEEDASFGDPSVQAGSVHSEENMVEVTVTKDSDVSRDNHNEILGSGTPLPDALRQLFNIRILPGTKEMIQTGWNSVNPTGNYPDISERVRSTTRQSSEQSGEGSNASSSDELDDDATHSVPAESFHRAVESSEEEVPVIMEPSEVNGRGGRGNSKKNKRREKKMQRERERKDFSKKGKKFLSRHRVPDQPSPINSISNDDDDDALVRLREAILVDWNPEAFDSLFGGRGDEGDSRGVDTMKDPPTLDDPETNAKRARRQARKRNGITLEECFAETSKCETLSEENAWYCGRCKELRRATKTLEIWTLPDILVIHLKRFSSNRRFGDKIEALVDCPLEGLDLTDRVGLPEGKSAVYDLFAVDNHYGGLGGGHYTACAKNFFDGQWYDYNGMTTSPTSVGLETNE